MLNIILLLLLGSGLAYISKYNLMSVNVDLGIYMIVGVPLFYVIVGSLLLGLVFSYLIQILKDISNYLLVRSKSKQIKNSQEDVIELTKTVHHLELENEKLKHAEPIEVDENAL